MGTPSGFDSPVLTWPPRFPLVIRSRVRGSPKRPSARPVRRRQRTRFRLPGRRPAGLVCCCHGEQSSLNGIIDPLFPTVANTGRVGPGTTGGGGGGVGGGPPAPPHPRPPPSRPRRPPPPPRPPRPPKGGFFFFWGKKKKKKKILLSGGGGGGPPKKKKRPRRPSESDAVGFQTHRSSLGNLLGRQRAVEVLAHHVAFSERPITSATTLRTSQADRRSPRSA